MKKKTYIIGNWKMNKTLVDVEDFCSSLTKWSMRGSSHLEVGVAPAAIHLPVIRMGTDFSVVAQNISSEENGAYTGEISASMVSEYARYVLVGHSERRMYFNETNDILVKKLILCYKHNLIPIFCFGESLESREKGDYLSIIKQQLEEVILSVPFTSSPSFATRNLVLAYEPVWAIGTAEPASPDQISEVHDFVCDLLINKLGKLNDYVPILYGGSCNSENAKLILGQKNVNGLLIGGASLDCDHFSQIIKIAHELY